MAESVADALLNHRQSATRGGVLGVYQRADRHPERRQALEFWQAIQVAQPYGGLRRDADGYPTIEVQNYVDGRPQRYVVRAKRKGQPAAPAPAPIAPPPSADRRCSATLMIGAGRASASSSSANSLRWPGSARRSSGPQLTLPRS